MKVVYLVLALVTSESYVLHKIKFETTTCDEIHESIKYKEIDGRTITTYQNKIAFAHWCLSYYLGYEYE